MLAKEKINEIVNLIKEKKILFLKFEEYSHELLKADVENMIEFDGKRQMIRKEIESLDKHLVGIYENEADADRIYRAVKNKENRSDVEAEYLEIFDEAQTLFTIIYRIQENEKLVMEHLMNCKAELLGQIKEANQTSKVAGYLKSMSDNTIPEGSLLSPNSRKM